MAERSIRCSVSMECWLVQTSSQRLCTTAATLATRHRPPCLGAGPKPWISSPSPPAHAGIQTPSRCLALPLLCRARRPLECSHVHPLFLSTRLHANDSHLSMARSVRRSAERQTLAVLEIPSAAGVAEASSFWFASGLTAWTPIWNPARGPAPMQRFVVR